jgi:hypothetical protein
MAGSYARSAIGYLAKPTRKTATIRGENTGPERKKVKKIQICSVGLCSTQEEENKYTKHPR